MPVTGSCGAEDLANDLLPVLTTGKDFSLPEVNFDDIQFQLSVDLPGYEPTRLTNEDLTERKVNGQGTFDAIMAGAAAHLRHEFEKNRITGEQYTKAFIELADSSMQNAVSFLLQRDSTYWAALTARLNAQVAQAQVVKARVDLEISKAQLKMLRVQAATVEADYGLKKMQLATESVQYCTAKFNLSDVLPQQKLLLVEQTEAQRAQTMDTRTDGTTAVVGILGKQKDLYAEQITSYKRDAENKVAKIFSDAWITMKTLDEGLLPPTNYTNTSLEGILTALSTNVGLT